MLNLNYINIMDLDKMSAGKGFMLIVLITVLITFLPPVIWGFANRNFTDEYFSYYLGTGAFVGIIYYCYRKIS